MKNKNRFKQISNHNLTKVSGGAEPAGIKTAVTTLVTDAKAGNTGNLQADAAAIKTAALAFAATKGGA